MPCMQAGVTYGFSFYWDRTNDVFAPRAISRPGASTAVDW
jgi:hypothetical protein